MTLKRLINALELNEVGEYYWWDILGSIQNAKKTVQLAAKEVPRKEDLIILCNFTEVDLKNKDAYNKCLGILRRELIEIES